MLGVWSGEHFVSPIADEVKLQQLVQLLDQMFDRCNQTVAATPRLLHCWLHSYSQHKYFPKPFTLPRKPKSQQKYQAWWKQFICFAFRVWKTGSVDGLQRQVYGDIQFSQRQQDLMSGIWAYLDSPSSGPNSGNSPSPEMGSEMGLESDPKMGPEMGPEMQRWHSGFGFGRQNRGVWPARLTKTRLTAFRIWVFFRVAPAPSPDLGALPHLGFFQNLAPLLRLSRTPFTTATGPLPPPPPLPLLLLPPATSTTTSTTASTATSTATSTTTSTATCHCHCHCYYYYRLLLLLLF